jgi:hypothetical protein
LACFHEVRRFKTFGEPPVYGCERAMCFASAPLFLPQAAQAHRGSQLERSGALSARNFERSLQRRLGPFFDPLTAANAIGEKQLSSEPM